MNKLADMKPERLASLFAPGGNILPVMKTWKNYAPALKVQFSITTISPKQNERLVGGRTQQAL